MVNRKVSSAVTRSEFLKETQSLRKDLKNLDQKVSTLDQKVNNIAREVGDTKDRIMRVEENMATKADIRKVLDFIDAFAQRIETYDRKAVVHDHRLNETETALKDHETRIVQLEGVSSK